MEHLASVSDAVSAQQWWLVVKEESPGWRGGAGCGEVRGGADLASVPPAAVCLAFPHLVFILRGRGACTDAALPRRWDPGWSGHPLEEELQGVTQ